MGTLKALYQKYKELILYVFFGGLTTLVNWGGYWLLADLWHVPYLWATAIAQIAAILFAYVTNRIWVFESKAKGFSAIFWEMVRFFGCRAFSFVLDLLCMRVGVGALGINDKVMKLLSNVIVIIVNYVFSKLIVFRKPKQSH
ncbi:MAG: GtrA family protein [Acutalibacter sp.]|jgi:putative flippase GtrA